ncbi:MAG: hypothetical protein AAFR23_08175, partial [Pseudomonadota bacterium]
MERYKPMTLLMWRNAMVLTAVSLVGAASPVQAQTPSNGQASLAIVFDGSGSMWGRVQGADGAKFQNARDALIATVGGRAPSAADQDPRATIATLRRFNPRGRGPIVAAMLRAG